MGPDNFRLIDLFYLPRYAVVYALSGPVGLAYWVPALYVDTHAFFDFLFQRLVWVTVDAPIVLDGFLLIRGLRGELGVQLPEFSSFVILILPC